MRTTEHFHYDEDGEVVSSVHVHRVNLDKDAPRDENGNRQALRVTTTGGDVTVPDGAVLVRASNPNFWDVLTEDDFAKTGYTTDAAPSAEPVATEPEPFATEPDVTEPEA